MKNKIKNFSIIMTVFIAVNFLSISTGFAAPTMSSLGKEYINQYIEEYDIKNKVNDRINTAIINYGQKMFNTLTKSIGIDIPATTKPVPAPISDKSSKDRVLKNKTIVIDPGHGGNNPGAVNYDLRESDNNLAVGLKVQKILQSRGAEVIMTRTSDTNVAAIGRSLSEELQARVDIAQKNNADIFVSVHTNSNENRAIKGAMTFFYDDESKSLATVTQENLINSTSAIDKGIAHGNFLVLRNSKIPAILVEMGFISNQAEAIQLSEDAYRNYIAIGIANGITDYFEKNA